MDSIVVRGGKELSGTIATSGAKNAALPLLCATLLSRGESRLTNVPRLRDIETTGALLRFLGRDLHIEGDALLVREERSEIRSEAPYELVKQMRASILVLGPLVARYGKAKVSLPGGCQIGARPVDQHLKGLEALGATLRLERGYVFAEAPRLIGAEILFDLPTVTGTENLMMAAALAKGTSTLVNCAREPEIEELAEVLSRMGARVDGAGTDVITVHGADELAPIEHAVRPDRIEAGTYMVAAAAAGGSVLVANAPAIALEALVAKLRQAGVKVEKESGGLRITRDPKKPIKPVDVTTAPHPGFPTDMQAQFLVLMCAAQGTSRISETIFENRFMHVPELIRMGAHIDLDGHTAHVHGGKPLSGAEVMATDLRASASLVIAGLIANDETQVRRVYHLDRGYDHMERKLAAVGADIQRVAGQRG